MRPLVLASDSTLPCSASITYTVPVHSPGRRRHVCTADEELRARPMSHRATTVSQLHQGNRLRALNVVTVEAGEQSASSLTSPLHPCPLITSPLGDQLTPHAGETALTTRKSGCSKLRPETSRLVLHWLTRQVITGQDSARRAPTQRQWGHSDTSCLSQRAQAVSSRRSRRSRRKYCWQPPPARATGWRCSTCWRSRSACGRVNSWRCTGTTWTLTRLHSRYGNAAAFTRPYGR